MIAGDEIDAAVVYKLSGDVGAERLTGAARREAPTDDI